MPRSYTYCVEGRPRPKERPRMGRGGRVYTPATTVAYEETIAQAYKGPLYEGPVAVEIDYEDDCQIITLKPVKRDPSRLRFDIDNAIKATLDGLQRGAAFENDRQVVDVWACKW